MIRSLHADASADRPLAATLRSTALLGAALIALPLAAGPARAAEPAVVTTKSLSPETALELARAALDACRQRGFQVAVAVVDRSGALQVMLRDRFAGPHTPTTATGKAWTAVSFRTDTTELVGMTQPGMPQAGVRALPGAVVLGGGLMVEGGGALLGGIGVSGAPGGEADDACAKAGLEAIRDKLDL
ncbi:GlcG/HbpS family heme-binding protein [Rhodoplanes sp. SY1]|uniref:GlcG/HbpS family heme-binding protein n=1 Tax=Rhodoplanes sp. SY1 TaxID=3166646 RepID=UPI0038B42934